MRRWRSSKRHHKKDEAAELRHRFLFFHLVLALMFLGLLGRLWQMQVVQGEEYRQRAERNALRLVMRLPQRGLIYDRNGVSLVQNVPSFTAALVLADLPLARQEVILSQLGQILGVSQDQLRQLVDKERTQRRFFTPIPVAEGISQDKAFFIEEHSAQLPGVVILTEPVRYYPEGALISHSLGYVGRISPEEYNALKGSGYDRNDRLGKTGVEKVYQVQLRGQPGWDQIEVDADGRELRTLATQAPVPGNNLVLTIDIELQRKMAEYLAQGKGASGYAVAIAMNPQTGEILGLVSLPSYDNNLFSYSIAPNELSILLEDPGRPLMDHAIGGMYPPGSVFKLVAGLGALQEGVAGPNTQILSTGQISLLSQYDPSVVYTFKDWAALGLLNFYEAVARSSDVYFYYLAGGYQGFRGLGAERLARYARELGFGQPTGVDLIGETPGIVPDPEWKQKVIGDPWFIGDTYHFGIGQGFVAVTPLQLLNAFGVVANGGNLMQPQIVREVVDGLGKVVTPFTPKIRRKVAISSDNLAIFGEGMRQAVAWGTATLAQVPGVVVAGKTGTSEYGAIDPATGEYPTHGWFVGMAPYPKPEIAVVVFVEQGRGAQTAAPIGGQIIRYYFERGKEGR
ncbi:MAG: penicillin-binding protein 2 [Chloroflexi bacterium]|nr:penicillin-binding protein 2 [Chloroflexota bacterium]